MTHPRTDLRNAVADAIEANFAANLQDAPVVLRANLRTARTPSAQIVAAGEEAENKLTRGVSSIVNRIVRVGVLLRAKGRAAQDDLDAMAECVERAVTAISRIGAGRSVALRYRSMELTLDSEQSDPVGTMTLVFEALWVE